VPTPKHSATFLNFAECQAQNTQQSSYTLPSVKTKTLGKVSKLCRVSSKKHSAKFLNFTECQGHNTRQSLDTLPSVTLKTLGKQARNDQILWSLCLVSIIIHSAKPKTLGKEESQNNRKWPLHRVFWLDTIHNKPSSQFTINHHHRHNKPSSQVTTKLQ